MGGRGVTLVSRGCHTAARSSPYADDINATDDVTMSVKGVRRRAGTAVRRSQSAAGMDIVTSSGDVALTIVGTGAGAA